MSEIYHLSVQLYLWVMDSVVVPIASGYHEQNGNAKLTSAEYLMFLPFMVKILVLTF